MPQAKPYQPLALRMLHGSIAALIIIAIFTGVAIYNIYDGRIGHLPIPTIPRIMGIHKLFGRAFLLVMPFFALYSFHAGRRRLLQADSVPILSSFANRQPSVVGKPIWWYALHRIVNTILLLATTFALVSGRQMNEGWLKQGELDQLWYTLHLASWVMMFGCLSVHLLLSARIGGVPLWLSMFDLKYRFGDRPSLLLQNLRLWFLPKQSMAFMKTHILQHNLALLGAELLVTIGIVFAWISLIPVKFY